MHSPVNISFEQFIQLNKWDTSTPIYIQLVNEMVKAIHLGHLPHQTKLPGTRQLVKILGINRNTIIKAFEELEAQNYIQILPNKGTYVYFPHQTKGIQKQKNLIADQASFPFNSSRYFDYKKEKLARYHLTIPSIDMRLIDLSLTNRVEHQLKNKHLNEDEIKSTLTNYVRMTKGIRMNENHLAILNQYKTSLHLLAQLLINKNNYLAVAEKSEPMVNAIFQHYGWNIVPIAMDEYGIIPSELEKALLRYDIKCLYLQTNYGYPTTLSHPIHRQTEIQQIISLTKGLIIEDDSFGEFHYSSIPSNLFIQNSLDQNIIYITQIGKHLRSEYQKTLMVGPRDFIEVINNYHVYYTENLYNNLNELNYLFNEGLYIKSLKKVKKELRERRDYLGNLLLLHFGKDVQFKLPKGGLHLWVTFQFPLNLMKIRHNAFEMDLNISSECIYQSKNSAHLLFPFASHSTDELEIIVDILSKCVVKQLL